MLERAQSHAQRNAQTAREAGRSDEAVDITRDWKLGDKDMEQA